MFRPITLMWDLVSSVNIQATEESCVVGFGKTQLLRTEVPIIVRLVRLSCEARDFFYTALHKARLQRAMPRGDDRQHRGGIITITPKT